MQFVQDNQGGVPGSALDSHSGVVGAVWTRHPAGAGAIKFNIDGTRLYSDSAPHPGVYLASGVAGGASYSVQAALINYGATSSDYYSGVLAEIDPALLTCYAAVYSYLHGRWELRRYLGGVATVLGSGATPGIGADPVEALVRLAIGVAAQQMAVSVDGGAHWSTVATAADTAVPATGRVGVIAVGDYGQGANILAILAQTIDAPGVSTDDPRWLFSPYNWEHGAGFAQATNPGAYCQVGFTGTGAALAVDVSPLAGAPSASYPTIRCSVDGGPWADRQLASTDTTIPLAGGLAGGTHTLRIWLLRSDPALDRWIAPASVLRITGLALDAGATAIAPAPRPRRVLCLGDSITEATKCLDGSNTLAAQDATQSYAVLLAEGLGAEVGILGYDLAGYVHAGAGNVPSVGGFWDHYRAGSSRLAGGLLNPQPDCITVMLGVNDAHNGVADGAVQAAIVALLGALRAAAPHAAIYLLTTVGGEEQAALAAALAQYQAASPDGGAVLLADGVDAAHFGGYPGPASPYSFDALHPNPAGHAALAARLLRAIAGAPGAPVTFATAHGSVTATPNGASVTMVFS